jgi:hypothetical protein
MFLPKTSGLGIRWRFSMYLQHYGLDHHFQLQKKLGARFFQFSFWSVILNQMPIHEQKECPNRIITSSNMGITNLVKETLPPIPYIKPPFTFPAFKEKHKCISASVRTWIFYISLIYFSCVRANKPHVHADKVLSCVDAVKTHPRVKLRPGGKNGQTRTSRRWNRTDGRNGRPNGHFYPKTFVMTTLGITRKMLKDQLHLCRKIK